MTDETRLVRTVLARWGEPLPRLVYADWLDERGNPGSVQKARFLRVWCELADTPVTDLPGYADRTEELEGLKPGLDPEWVALMEGNRYHLTDPEVVRARVEAYLLVRGSDPQHGHLEIADVVEEQQGDWGVWLRRPDTPLRLGAGYLPVAVDRRTGRVYKLGSHGRRYRLS